MLSLLLQIHILLYQKCPRKHLIEQDADHWKEIFRWEGNYPQVIKRLLKEKEEFRNLFYYRLGNAKGLLPLLKKSRLLYPHSIYGQMISAEDCSYSMALQQL